MLRAAKRCVLGILFCIGLRMGPFGFEAASAHSSVPLRAIDGNILVVPVSLNGQGPYDFLVDTGTNTTLVDPELAAQLGLKPVDRISLSTLAGSTAVPRYFLDSISVGTTTVSHVEVLGEQLAAVRRLDTKVRGILGFNVLSEFSFRIDYKRKQLDLFLEGETPTIVGGKRVNVEILEGRILVPAIARASPGEAWRLALDSGVSQVVLFADRGLPLFTKNYSRFRNDAFASNRSAGSATSTRIKTNVSERTASILKLDALDIGSLHVRNLSVVILNMGMSTPSPIEDGLLPCSLFRAVFFDRESSSIVFDPD